MQKKNLEELSEENEIKKISALGIQIPLITYNELIKSPPLRKSERLSRGGVIIILYDTFKRFKYQPKEKRI